ncbi:MAG: hypothetical protein HZC29_01820 [Thaumarchaeota archaeon]|nr:hypothetical protein [Nitrososphaerota archaeon]
METDIPRRKPHPQKKEATRSITYRFTAKIVDELETEAMQKNISHNVLVKQILEKYLVWDRFAEKIGMIPIPKSILEELGKEMSGTDINRVINTIVPLIKESVMFMKGTYDLKRCIESLEDYMRASGMKSDHRVEGGIHHFIIQHELGLKLSFFTEQLFKEIFHEFLPNKTVKIQNNEKTVIASIELGSDFSEHEY